MRSIKPKKKKALSTKESIELTQEMVSLLSGPTLTLEPAASSLTPIMPTAESKRFTKAIIDLLAGNNKDMSDEENLSPEHNDSKENNGIHLDIDHLIEASKPVSFLSGSSATLGLSEEELAMAIQESIKFNGEKEGYPDCSGSRSGFFYSAKEERKRER